MSQGLLLSDRVAHLQSLHDTLGSDLSAVVCGKINTDSQPGDTTIQFRKFLTLSTYSMLAEAVDFTGDFIILATPKSAVEQATGRILRGKNSGTRPVIIDVVDPFSMFIGMARKREKYYQSKGYEITQARI